MVGVRTLNGITQLGYLNASAICGANMNTRSDTVSPMLEERIRANLKYLDELTYSPFPSLSAISFDTATGTL